MKEGETTVPVTIRLTAPQRDKLRDLGGAQWVRQGIDEQIAAASAAKGRRTKA